LNDTISIRDKDIKRLNDQLNNADEASNEMQIIANEQKKLLKRATDAESMNMSKENEIKRQEAKLKEMNKESRAINENY